MFQIVGGWSAVSVEPAEDASEAEPVDRDVERELSHDDFDPIGTVVLLVIYTVVIGVMWVFMYFVEFLGNGPTVIG